MANEHNLRAFPKGVAQNPAGRKKGSPNRSTVARLVLGMEDAAPPEILEELRRKYPAINEPLTVELIVTLKMAREAMNGSVQAYVALMNSAYGAPKQEVETVDRTIVLIDELDEEPPSGGNPI